MGFLLLPFRLLRLLMQSIWLALGQVWANKMRSILTTTGIIIGVASVTAVIAGLTGLKAKVLSDFESIGVNRIGVWPMRPQTGPLRRMPWSRVQFLPEQFDGLLQHCPSVAAFTRVAGWSDRAQHGDRTVEDVQLYGIDAAWHKVENRSVILGRPFSMIDEAQARRVCLLTAELRDKLNLARDCVGESVVLGGRSFLVVGVVEPPVKMELVNRTGPVLEAFVPFSVIWRERRPWFNIGAIAKSPDVAEEAKAEITFFLRHTRHLKPDEPNTFGVETVQRILEQFNSVALAITAVAGGIVAISLLVGGIGIMNIMLVSVSERTREIGLRKAVGARPAVILFQFLVEAVTLCLIGGLVGVGVGYLLTTAMAHVPNAQLDRAYIPTWAIALSFGFATAVGMFFGMFPAIKAARLDPIEALRHE